MYKNIQLIKEDYLSLIIYNKDNFGDLYFISEEVDSADFKTILNNKIELSYTSTFHQYVQYGIYNYFLYASYENNSNY